MIAELLVMGISSFFGCFAGVLITDLIMFAFTEPGESKRDLCVLIDKERLTQEEYESLLRLLNKAKAN